MSYATLNDGTHNMRYTRMVPEMVSIIIQLDLGGNAYRYLNHNCAKQFKKMHQFDSYIVKNYIKLHKK